MTKHNIFHAFTIAALSSTLLACNSSNNDISPVEIPQLSPATAANLSGNCNDLAASMSALANTTITSSSEVAAGELMVAGNDIPAHCLVTGSMFERVSDIDGNVYAIRFEMRLPLNWNGRFYHQGNGGIDGSVVTAVGDAGPGNLSNALYQGFAVLSSDAGHSGALGPALVSIRLPDWIMAIKQLRN